MAHGSFLSNVRIGSGKGGRLRCNLSVVKVVRGATQVAREVLGMDNLVWMIRAFHGSDEARGPPDKRKSAPCTACCLVRRPNASLESVDHWACEVVPQRSAGYGVRGFAGRT